MTRRQKYHWLLDLARRQSTRWLMACDYSPSPYQNNISRLAVRTVLRERASREDS